MTLDLVLARFNETVAFLDRVPPSCRVIVYNAGALVDIKGAIVVPIPDAGQEAGAFLHHIVTEYDTLADYTVFSQADPAPHMSGGCMQVFYDALSLLDSGAAPNLFPIGAMSPTGREAHLARRLHLHHKKNPAIAYGNWPLDDFCMTVLHKHPPESWTHPAGNIGAVHRDLIRARPLDFWKRLQALVCHTAKPFEAGVLEHAMFPLILAGY